MLRLIVLAVSTVWKALRQTRRERLISLSDVLGCKQASNCIGINRCNISHFTSYVMNNEKFHVLR